MVTNPGSAIPAIFFVLTGMFFRLSASMDSPSGRPMVNCRALYATGTMVSPLLVSPLISVMSAVIL